MDLIVTHINADFDAFGSAVAASKLYPDADILLPGSQEKGVRDFLALCKDLLRIRTERDVNLDSIDRLIVVETPYSDRIGKAKELLSRPIEVHLYDHHPCKDGDIKPKYKVCRLVGATVTILTGLIKERGVEITPLEATIMALGIYQDTGSLTFPTTTLEDVDGVSFLISRGADLSAVSKYLASNLSEDERTLLSRLMGAVGVHNINGIDIGVAALELDRYMGDLPSLTHKLLDIENLEAIFLLAKIGEKVHIIGRSLTSAVDTRGPLRAFGGGGHRTASSARAEGDLNKIRHRLVRLLKKYIRPNIFAKDIMLAPARLISPQRTVKEAYELLRDASQDGFIVSERGKMRGIISRWELEKALRQGFGHSRVKGYMKRNVFSVAPNTPLAIIRKIMVDNKTGQVPVVDKGRLVGMVTRTLLLRALYKGLISDGGRKALAQKITIKNIRRKMEKNLPPEIVKLLRRIGRIAEGENYRVYVVGGFVRDLLMGSRNLDVDVVVEGDGIRLAGILAHKLKGTPVAYKKFGTAIIFLRAEKMRFISGKRHLRIDIATAREESYSRPGALPDVEASSLAQDLYRRDFTINAMAISINKKGFGNLIDYFGGMNDLKAGRIKVMHDRSFVDDPTRIFRAVRFEQRYGFRIDERTQMLIKSAVDFKMFDRVSGERLREEVKAILSEERPVKAIARMQELGELKFVHPKIIFDADMERLVGSVQDAIGWFKLSYIGRPGAGGRRALDEWLIYFMALLDKLNYNETLEVCDKFVLAKGDAKRVRSCKDALLRARRVLSAKREIAPSSIYKALEPLSYEAILFLMAKCGGEGARRRIGSFLTKYNGLRPDVAGRDLKRMGFSPSPLFKRALERVLYAKIDGTVRTREGQLLLVKKILTRYGGWADEKYKTRADDSQRS